ncbi:hypothetical protein [Amycolatopsis tucumanensis]|uniref:hypothetical protein n=1 Tax=Amycolatopsis tucumanensis TaxID=401106 RepID=UPI003558E1DB
MGDASTLSTGKRGEILELKPNNRRAIRLGERQMQSYVDELNQLQPNLPPFTGRVVTC